MSLLGPTARSVERMIGSILSGEKGTEVGVGVGAVSPPEQARRSRVVTSREIMPR